ncbi:Protein trichome birefringence-like 41 [Bienertia sinuspersici]
MHNFFSSTVLFSEISTRKHNNNTMHLHLIVVILVIFSWFSLNEAKNHLEHKKQPLNQCNIFKGHWAWDDSYPMYDSSKCPEIRHEFDCLKFGRPDEYYLKFRWQPDDCDIPRFDGVDFLTRMRGKKIMFVGDSLSLNNYQSLICLLHAAVPSSNIIQATGGVQTWIFLDYNVSITMYSALYLVDIDKEQIGRVMKLDSVNRGGNVWKEADVLVFNTWLWWYTRGPKQPWDYIQEGNIIQKDMDRMVAFERH